MSQLCQFVRCAETNHHSGGGAIAAYYGSLKMMVVAFEGNEGNGKQGKDLLVWDAVVTIDNSCPDGVPEEGDSLSVARYGGKTADLQPSQGGVVGYARGYYIGTCWGNDNGDDDDSTVASPSSQPSSSPSDAPTIHHHHHDGSNGSDGSGTAAIIFFVILSVAVPAFAVVWAVCKMRLIRMRRMVPVLDLMSMEDPLLEVSTSEETDSDEDGAKAEAE